MGKEPDGKMRGVKMIMRRGEEGYEVERGKEG
jgi:hypothetical protein